MDSETKLRLLEVQECLNTAAELVQELLDGDDFEWDDFYTIDAELKAARDSLWEETDA